MAKNGARKNGAEGPSGFAIVDKEAGWTSHDVVARARRLLNTRKIGHSGTLDPPATGVLILGIGRGTKLLRFITELPKTYVATFRVGTETSTLDAEGEVTATHDMSHVDLDAVRRAAAAFVGDIDQIPPMVSAVKVDGRRLHELAREGKEVERRPRPVTIHSLEIDAGDRPDEFVMTVSCSSGTYVRTLAADIGHALGGGAHVRTLRRTAIGSFDERDAAHLESYGSEPGSDNAADAGEPAEGRPRPLLPLAEGLRGRPSVTVQGDLEVAVRHGKVLERVRLGVDGDGPWVVLDSAGGLLAVYESHRGSTVKPAVVVAPAAT